MSELHPDLVIGRLAGAQHNVVARWQLLAAGLGVGQIKARIGSGHLVTIHRGVYAVGHRSLTRYGRWMAAVLAGGPSGLLASRHALCARGVLEEIPGPVHVISTSGGTRATGIRFHRASFLDEQQRDIHFGIPITSVERSLVDFAGAARPKQLTECFDEASNKGLIDRRELGRICDLLPRKRGMGRIRTLLAAKGSPIEDNWSPLEREFRRFCIDRDLPPPSANVPFAGYVVDVAWPKFNLIVELDSWGHHGDREAFEEDRKKDVAVQIAGARIVRVTRRRLRGEPAQLEGEIRALMATVQS